MEQSTATKTKDLSPYLGHIHYKDGDGRDVIARGAVWCADRAGFDTALEVHLSAQGASFLWSEEVHEATDWLKKHGHNGLMAGLARKVDGMVPVALSEPKTAHDETPEDESYLIIEEIENVEPLDMQMGVYPKLTVPAAIQEAIFGQPEPTEAEIEAAGGNAENVPTMGTYAILDAAKMPYLLTTALSQSDLEYQSLFQGVAQEELGEHAPYIVRLEGGNDFTRKLFTGLKPPLGLWEKELGIFIRSRASLAELRKHFRKFTKVQDESGKWYYFRFWESSTMTSFMSSWADLTQSNFFTTSSNHVISYLIARADKNTCHTMQLKKAKYNPNAGSYLLTQDDKNKLTQSKLMVFEIKLIAHLSQNNKAFGDLDDQRKVDLVKTIIADARRYGIKIEKAVADFAEASFLHGRPLDKDETYKTLLENKLVGQIKKSAILLDKVRSTK